MKLTSFCLIPHFVLFYFIVTAKKDQNYFCYYGDGIPVDLAALPFHMEETLAQRRACAQAFHQQAIISYFRDKVLPQLLVSQFFIN